MRLLVLAALAVAVALAPTSAASSASPDVPTGLHGFMLRADEPPTDVFHRTPSFAWAPYPRATGYQFQLSMSSTFRDSAIFYDTNTLTTPVVAPPLTLPWITGSPHSLYARVRATLDNGDVTPWSADYGFDVVAPTPPTPLASDPGLLRWAPVEGATSYQVWLVDVPKNGQAPGKGKENVHTNVLDERELYTFHQSPQWTSSVRWRVRAVRSTEAPGPSNGLPAATYGAWSAIYRSTNPPVSASGAITPLHTISDVVSDGSDTSSAHRLMPAFTWTGNQTLSGASAELFRVYVFTDAQCLNRVFTSAVVGGPAYGPRSGGPLQLPSDSSGITAARGAYLDDGAEPSGQMFDGTSVTAQESVPAAAPTSAPPVGLGPSGSGSGSGSGSAPAPSGGASGAPSSAGAPVDLWDTDSWPKGGYYWTVVGVAALPAAVGASTVAAPGASKGSTLLPVSDVSKFSQGQSITIGVAPNSDTSTIGAIGNGLITLTSPLNNGHGAGEPIASTVSSGVVYQDMEMPQDVCQAVDSTGNHFRVHRFGITSEPALTTAQEPFATGLAPNGRLVSAAQTGVFYGQPLVAWTASLSANTYQVQWSAKAYPFTPEGSIMTPSNATVLKLGVGTWYYRVRGFDYSLPTGSQALSWSETEKLVVAAPSFKLSTPPAKKFRVTGP